MTHKTPEEQLAVVYSLMGARYKLNGRNREEGLDCQTCTQIIQKECFGRTIPEITIENDSVAAYIKAVQECEQAFNWQQIEKPVHGCIVELCRGNIPHHCGTYFDLPEFNVVGLIHCLKGAGVIYDPVITLKAAGWRRFIYNVPRNS